MLVMKDNLGWARREESGEVIEGMIEAHFGHPRKSVLSILGIRLLLYSFTYSYNTTQLLHPPVHATLLSRILRFLSPTYSLPSQCASRESFRLPIQTIIFCHCMHIGRLLIYRSPHLVPFSILCVPYIQFLIPSSGFGPRFQVMIHSYYHLSPGRMLPLVIRPMTTSRHAQLKALANTPCLCGAVQLYHNLWSLHQRPYLYTLPLVYFVVFSRKRGRTYFLYSPQTVGN
jgi:hypothetical protein